MKIIDKKAYVCEVCGEEYNNKHLADYCEAKPKTEKVLPVGTVIHDEACIDCPIGRIIHVKDNGHKEEVAYTIKRGDGTCDQIHGTFYMSMILTIAESVQEIRTLRTVPTPEGFKSKIIFDFKTGQWTKMLTITGTK
jgi:hypothetical protein